MMILHTLLVWLIRGDAPEFSPNGNEYVGIDHYLLLWIRLCKTTEEEMSICKSYTKRHKLFNMIIHMINEYYLAIYTNR